MKREAKRFSAIKTRWCLCVFWHMAEMLACVQWAVFVQFF